MNLKKYCKLVLGPVLWAGGGDGRAHRTTALGDPNLPPEGKGTGAPDASPERALRGPATIQYCKNAQIPLMTAQDVLILDRKGSLEGGPAGPQTYAKRGARVHWGPPEAPGPSPAPRALPN